MREIQSIDDKVGGVHRYALAVLLVFAATAVRFSAEGLIPNQPFPSYFFAVLVTAAVAGAAPTALATMLSAIAGSYFFIEPHGSWHIGEKTDLVRTVVFIFVGLGVAAFAYARERAFRRAVTAEVALAEARSRETATANLKTKEAFIAGVLDSLPHNIAVISATGVVLSINRQWQRFAVENDGSSAFVSVGANYLAVSRSAAEGGDRYAREALQGLESLLRGEQTSFEMEYPCHAPDQERWFVMHAARAESAPAAVVISHTDITERKRALDAFRESEERFASFMRNLPGLAWIKDLQGRYLYATETTMRAFRTTQEKLYGNTDDRIFDAETAAQFRRNDEKALTSEKGVISVETLAQDDGRIHHSIVSKFPIKDADDVACAVGGVAIDITERVEAERQLRDATQRLQEADRRKDEFLATLAHELRNPLAPIYNAVSLLRRDAVDSGWNERRLKLLSMAERQIHHLIRLVDDLLEVSRISCGKIALKKQDMDLAEALRNAIDVAAPVLAERGHKLDLSLPEEPLIVSADSVRLTQIFANLLNNAANYTEPGGVISVEARRGRDEAIVAVRDSGVGIAADMLPRIFDLFTQVDQSSGPRRAGLGIGLALVRSLVEMHGGRVEAQSDGVGQGSVFTVRLPLRSTDSVCASKGAGPETPAQPGRRILVIDDEHDVADSLVMLLEMLGAKTEVAYNGESGLAKLREFNPDVVFLDLGMPQMDGYETARRIRALPEGRTVKLIALTGWGDNMIFPRTLEAGFDKKMTKPASFESLRDAVAS